MISGTEPANAAVVACDTPATTRPHAARVGAWALADWLLPLALAAVLYLVSLRLLARATTLAGLPLRLGAVAATLFFALHPLRAESVAWVTERRDVLSGLFFLLTILAYLRMRDASGPRRYWLLA